MSYEEVTIGQCRLIRGDCREVLPTLSTIDAVVTDPPYGINYQHGSSGRGIWDHRHIGGIIGDTASFNPQPFLDFPDVILWGANHYASCLPNSPGWLVWDKKLRLKIDNFSDCELAWHKRGTRTLVFRYLWNGLLAHERHEKRLHVMQKPLALMRWCVEKTMGVVLDPYMGSGSTGVACLQLQRTFIGIEIDHGAFDLACTRIEQATQQLALFSLHHPPPVTQISLFTGATP